MTQKTRRPRAPKTRLATTVLVFAGVMGAAGCSSVPDAVNPVEWYRGASDAVGGVFGGEPEAGKTAGDPGTSADTSYPNLASVPPRPTPSTTAEQREALKQGLVADRANARYTEPAASAPAASAPAASAPAATRPAAAAAAPQRSQPQTPPKPQSSAPRPAESQAALPAPAPAQPAPAAPAPVAAVPAAPATPQGPAGPAATTTAASSGSSERSALWPNRPAPETPGLRASTTGQVGGDAIHRSVAERSQTPLPAHASASRPPAPSSSIPSTPAPAAAGTSGRLAERTTLDSAGSGGAAPMTRSQPPSAPPPSEPPRPRVSEQSVIVNEDAIGGGAPVVAPAAGTLGGRRYLASTIYFGHGSANLTDTERREIADIAQAAAANGAAIQVIGHTSARTADLSMRDHETANLAMSMRRAQAVANVLIHAGMPADRVIVEARGDAQPEFYEVMPAGEAGNRRAEIVVIY